MELRVARHTNNLQILIDFYTSTLGLIVLGSFEDHAGYNGVFLGEENSNWHIEFTEDSNVANHHPDEDDLLVFYFPGEHERNTIKQNFIDSNISEMVPKNPYWKKNGVCFKDPDGYGIILAINNLSAENQ